jgi:sarcosine oxidase subunit beta
LKGSAVAGIQTEKGLVNTETLILAAGPFSRQIGRWIDVDLPLEIRAQQEATIHEHNAIPQDAPVTIDLDTAAFWRPGTSGGAEISTGITEPSKKPLDPVPIDRNYPAFAIEAASRLSPFWLEVATSLKARNVSLRAGQVTDTPDMKAIIGPHPDIQGLYLSVGHSGHGVMASPEAGRRLAALITAQESDDENPFSMRRFAEKRTLAADDIYDFEAHHQ